MKLRSAFLILICSLILGNAGPVFAADPSATRSDQATAIQNQYNPLFDAQYARLLAMRKKALMDVTTYASYKAVLVDFLDVRRIINDGLTSSTSDLDAVKSYAEEELGEFDSSLSELATQVVKIKTITCVKAKLVKKVTGLTPKCPKGYKKK